MYYIGPDVHKRTTIAKLMADDAMFAHGNALVQSKAEFLEAATKRRFRIRSFEITTLRLSSLTAGPLFRALRISCSRLVWPESNP